MDFIGRTKEIELLDSLYLSKESKIVVVYGRRRIGKSYLLQHWGKSKPSIFIEGVEGQISDFQINNFKELLATQINNPRLFKVKFNDWSGLLEEVSIYLKANNKLKTVLILDEIQWMAAGQSKLISLIKYFWDNHWSKLNIMLILCGSVASYITKKVIKSKALYGRISSQILLTELTPYESSLLAKKRGHLEILKYLLVFGGVPKYFQEIDQNKSFEKNINSLCFERTGFFFEEIDRIFYGQFREAKTYQKIIHKLSNKSLSFSELCKAMNVTPGGGFKEYLDNLELARFIRSYYPINAKGVKFKKYKIFDEYIIFYFKYIKPYMNLIEEGRANIFKEKILNIWKPWLGIAFENFCLKNAFYIAEKCGFASEVISFGPYISKEKDKSVQIDMVFERENKVFTVVEIKFREDPIGVEIVKEIEQKISKCKFPKEATVEKMLISLSGADSHLHKLDYFSHVVTLSDLFSKTN